MLSMKEIGKLLECLGRVKVAEFDGYEITKKSFGYSDDPEIGALQAKLSIMLQVNARAHDLSRARHVAKDKP